MFELNLKMIANAVIAGFLVWLLINLLTKRKIDPKTGTEKVSFSGSPVAEFCGFGDDE